MAKIKTGFTVAHLSKLKKEGKIRDYRQHEVKEETPLGKIVTKHFKKRSIEKDFIGSELLKWCQENKYTLYEEYRFDREGLRSFRFDWFIDGLCGIEYEGIHSDKSRHTTVTGYTRDVVKYNLAQAQRYKVIRLTASNYMDVIKEVEYLVKIS